MAEVKRFCCGSIAANCYAVINKGEAVIIDPGVSEPELIAFVENYKTAIRAVLLTHRHFDHVNAAGMIKKLTGCDIVISEADECGLNSDEKSLSALCDYAYGKADPTLKADVLVSDGDELEFCGMTFKVIATPGHTEGSVCFIAGEMLFSGDTLFKNSIGRTDFPTGDAESMMSSLKKLKALPQDTAVYPGHGDCTVLSRESISNPYMRNL